MTNIKSKMENGKWKMDLIIHFTLY